MVQSSQDMFDCLVQRGCTDLSLSLDKGRNSHKVIASGGFGDVWYATMFDGKPIAIKTLRLHILLQEDDKGLKVTLILPLLCLTSTNQLGSL